MELPTLILLIIATFFFIFFLLRILFSPRREYKMINGVPHVREKKGDWKPLTEHMKKKHPKEYEKIKKEEKKFK